MKRKHGRVPIGDDEAEVFAQRLRTGEYAVGMGNYDLPKPNIYAVAALEAARNGDWRPLDDYINRGFPLTDALRQYFRSLLPRAPRPRHRPKKTATQMQVYEIAAFVWRAQQDGAHDWTMQAAEHFGMHRRDVQKACEAFKKLDPEDQDFILQALAGKRPEPPALARLVVVDNPIDKRVAKQRLKRRRATIKSGTYSHRDKPGKL